MAERIEVRNDRQAKRYVAHLDGEMALLDYQFKEPVMIFTHIEVPPAMRGRGVGGAVARHALDEARSNGHRIVPLCPFVASYVRRHREYADLVPERYAYLVEELPGRDGE